MCMVAFIKILQILKKYNYATFKACSQEFTFLVLKENQD